MAKLFPGSTGISYKISGGKTTAYQTAKPGKSYSFGDILSGRTNQKTTTSKPPVQPTTQTTNQLAPIATPQTQAQSLIDVIAQKYNDMWSSFSSKLKEFEARNPFNFDQMLTEEKAKVAQRLDPYYNQTLSDYLTGVERRRTRSSEDERNLLSELQADTDAYTGRTQLELNKVLNNTRQGFADAGLYFSGARMGAEGQTTEQSQYNLSQFLRKQGERESGIRTTAQRSLEDINFEERLRKRDIERERQAQITQQSLSEVQQRQRQREFEKQQYIGAPPGANPLQYLSSSYNLLG